MPTPQAHSGDLCGAMVIRSTGSAFRLPLTRATSCTASVWEQNTARARQRADLYPRLDRTDLVVGGHHTDQRRLRANRCFHIAYAHAAEPIHRRDGQFVTKIISRSWRAVSSTALCSMAETMRCSPRPAAFEAVIARAEQDCCFRTHNP